MFTWPLGREDPPGPAPGTVQSSEAAPGHFHSEPPAPRQVLALPGAPAGLCAARAAPARVRMAGGTAAGAGRAAAVRGRRGRQPEPVPAVGGARGDRGAQPAGSRARVQAIRAGGRRGTGDCPTFPAERKGPPPRAALLNTDLPALRLPTAGSHRARPQKSFATPKAT